MVKAVRFYQLAGDINRTAAILDRALWRCSTALVRMSTVLTVHHSKNNYNDNSSSSGVVDFLYFIPRGLRMHPVHPSGPSVTGQTTLADYWDMRHYSESQPAVPLKDIFGTIQAIGEDQLFLLESFQSFLTCNYYLFMHLSVLF